MALSLVTFSLMRKLRLTLLYSNPVDAQVMTKLFIHAPGMEGENEGRVVAVVRSFYISEAGTRPSRTRRSRKAARPRLKRDFTVPSGTPS